MIAARLMWGLHLLAHQARHRIVLVFGVVFTVLCLLPLWVPGLMLANEPSADSAATLTSQGARTLKDTVVVSMTMMGLLLLDAAVDLRSWRGQPLTAWVCLLSMAAFNIVLLEVATPGSDSHVLWVMVSALDMGFIAAVTDCLQHNPSVRWSEGVAVAIVVSLGIANVTNCYSGFVVEVVTPLGITSVILLIAGIVIVYAQSYRSVFQRASGVPPPDSIALIFMGLFTSLLAGYVLIAIVFVVTPVSELIILYVCAHVAVCTGTTTFVCLAFTRLAARAITKATIARTVADETRLLQTSLDTKRQFVRLVSHEVRTPLNTVSLGLSLVEQQVVTLTNSWLAELSKLQEALPLELATQLQAAFDQLREHVRSGLADVGTIACEAKESVDVGVTILNDLLTYEKIEGDILALDAHVAPITPLLIATLRPFAVQARAAGVTITLEKLESNGYIESFGKLDAFGAVNFGTLGPQAPPGTLDTLSNTGVKSGADGSPEVPCGVVIKEVDGSGGNSTSAPQVCVMMDAPKIAQVIRNLVSNSLKFSTRGASVRVVAGTVYRPFHTTPLATGDTHAPNHTVSYSHNHLNGSNNEGTHGYHPAGAVTHTHNGTYTPTPTTLTNPHLHHHLPLINAGGVVCEVATSANGGSGGSNDTPTHWRLEVHDMGAGLTPEQQDHLFTEIVQFNPSKLQGGGGSGLGLYISHGIVLKHGGSLTVYSAGEGCGSMFVVELPIYYAHSDSSGGHALGSSGNNANNNNGNNSNNGNGSSGIGSGNKGSGGGSGSNTRAVTPSPLTTHVGGGGLTVDVGAPLHRSTSDVFNQQAFTAAGTSFGNGFSASNGNGNGFSGLESASGSPSHYTSVAILTPLHRTAAAATAAAATAVPSLLRLHPLTVCTLPTSRTPLFAHSTDVSPLAREAAGTGCSSYGGSGGSYGETVRSGGYGASASAGGGLVNLRVLIVDDSSATRKMVSRMLRVKGVCERAEEADNGASGLALILASIGRGVASHSGASTSCDPGPGTADRGTMISSSGVGTTTAATSSEMHRVLPFDIVLMDAVMPHMSGLVATQRARAAGYTGVILGLTGNALPADIAEFTAAGANRVLIKPLDVGVMLAAIGSRLTRYRPTRVSATEGALQLPSAVEDAQDMVVSAHVTVSSIGVGLGLGGAGGVSTAEEIVCV